MKRKPRILQERSGLHTVSTTILLIGIIIAMAGIAYIWTQVTTRAGNAIIIQSAVFNESTTTIYVQNIGEGRLNIDTVYIDTAVFKITSANCKVGSESTIALDKGETATITINNSYETKVHIRVICRENVSHESDYKP